MRGSLIKGEENERTIEQTRERIGFSFARQCGQKKPLKCTPGDEREKMPQGYSSFRSGARKKEREKERTRSKNGWEKKARVFCIGSNQRIRGEGEFATNELAN